MIKIFIGFLIKILKKRIVNTYYLNLYIHSRRDMDNSDIEKVSFAFLCGVRDIKSLAKMYPMFTRERIRQMLLKAERIGKAIHRGDR